MTGAGASSERKRERTVGSNGTKRGRRVSHQEHNSGERGRHWIWRVVFEGRSCRQLSEKLEGVTRQISLIRRRWVKDRTTAK